MEEHPYLSLERRRCCCKCVIVSLNVHTIDRGIVGSRLDHCCAVLRCWSQPLPLVIVVDTLYCFVILLAALGAFVYNTCVVRSFGMGPPPRMRSMIHKSRVVAHSCDCRRDQGCSGRVHEKTFPSSCPWYRTSLNRGQDVVLRTGMSTYPTNLSAVI